MSKKHVYILFGLVLLILRLVFNFKFELIPGINGGYYPLQVRTLLETGHLGFSDMPLYFYINAFFTKIISLFTTIEINQLIIAILKIIDSIALPLFLIPLYLINKNIFGNHLTKSFEIILVGFATLSFSPLILTSDLQKNAFAVPLMVFFIYFLLLFYQKNLKKPFILTIIFLILIGLTHFGVFAISLLLFITTLLCFYRKKALFPSLAILISGTALVFLFDPDRAERLLNLGNSIFEKPVILYGNFSPTDYVNYVLSYLLIALGIYHITRRKNSLTSYQINMLLAFLIVTFLLSFPLIDMEYSRRFSLILFIPQLILLSNLFTFFNRWVTRIISYLLIAVSITSIFLMTGNIKPPSITKQAFDDLKNIEAYISEPDETLIIARHGLEWWTAWQLRTKVGQDKSIEKNTFLKYQKVINLVQLSGINQMHPGVRSPFHEPSFQTDQKPIYVSKYFKATVIKKHDIEKIRKPTGDMQ
jgi:hypothetical protein